jgi:multiple sugar transport system permease protein/N,N'-diacetylchitobiose transport system permease protein
MLVTVVMAFPVYWMILTALKPTSGYLTATPQFWPHAISWHSFSEVWHDPEFLPDMKNTALITLGTVICAMVIGFLGALAIARFRFAGRKIFILVVLLVQMVPLIALTIPLSSMLGNAGLKDSIIGTVIAYLAFSMPYGIWTLRTFIANVPRELDEAALVDGCNRWQTAYLIILPLTLPGLVATAVYGWIQAWNEFLLANVLLTGGGHQTLQIWLISFQSSPTHGADWGGLMAGGTLTALPVVALFMAFQSRISNGLTAGAVKG